MSHRRSNAVACRACIATVALALAIVAAAAASPSHLRWRALGQRTTTQLDPLARVDARACRRHVKTRRRHAKQKHVRQRTCRHTLSRARAGDHPASGGLIVGLNADVAGWGGASTSGYLSRVIAQTGTKWLREHIYWNLVEPSPGRFNFAYYDHFMLLAAQRGERVLALLGNAPSWAASSPSAIPSDPSAYAAYVAAVVRRYGPHGSFWAQHPRLSAAAIKTYEFWNEPYYDNGDAGDYDPARYARLVQAAGAAGHAADPAARFLLSAEMQSARDSSGQWVWWTDALYRAVPNLNNYFDGVSIHDYGSDTTGLIRPVLGQPYDNYDRVRRAEDIHQQFISHGASGKPFWITETGWSTCTEASTDCVSPAQQAANLTTLFGYLRGSWKDWVQAVFVYRFLDGQNASTMQEGFGLTHLDGSPKPALGVFKAAALTSALSS